MKSYILGTLMAIMGLSTSFAAISVIKSQHEMTVKQIAYTLDKADYERLETEKKVFLRKKIFSYGWSHDSYYSQLGAKPQDYDINLCFVERDHNHSDSCFIVRLLLNMPDIIVSHRDTGGHGLAKENFKQFLDRNSGTIGKLYKEVKSLDGQDLSLLSNSLRPRMAIYMRRDVDVERLMQITRRMREVRNINRLHYTDKRRVVIGDEKYKGFPVLVEIALMNSEVFADWLEKGELQVNLHCGEVSDTRTYRLQTHKKTEKRAMAMVDFNSIGMLISQCRQKYSWLSLDIPPALADKVEVPILVMNHLVYKEN